MGYEMMGSAGAMGGWGMVFGGLMMIVWIALLVVVVVLVLRWLSGTNAPLVGGKPDPTKSALALVQERYARGEIDTAEFEERTQKLRQGLIG